MNFDDLTPEQMEQAEKLVRETMTIMRDAYADEGLCLVIYYRPYPESNTSVLMPMQIAG